MRIEGVPGVCRAGSDLLCYALGTLVLVFGWGHGWAYILFGLARVAPGGLS
jgi:hypothetical protein